MFRIPVVDVYDKSGPEAFRISKKTLTTVCRFQFLFLLLSFISYPFRIPRRGNRQLREITVFRENMNLSVARGVPGENKVVEAMSFSAWGKGRVANGKVNKETRRASAFRETNKQSRHYLRLILDGAWYFERSF